MYEELQRDSPKEVVAYFNKNWHPIKDEWVLGMKSDCGSFLNFTNDRLESLNVTGFERTRLPRTQQEDTLFTITR